MPRESPYSIALTPEEETKLKSIVRQYTSPYYLVVRSKIVLLAAQGFENKIIGQKLDLPRQIVSKWRKRFFEQRLEGLEDQARSGRPTAFSPLSGGSSKSPCL